MSIHVAWDDPRRAILCFTFQDQWNWDDLDDALSSAYALAGSVNHPVAFMADLRGTAHLPEDLVSQLKHLCETRHPNETIRVLVSDRSFWRSLYTVCTRLYPSASSRYLFAASPEQARRLIDRREWRQQAS